MIGLVTDEVKLIKRDPELVAKIMEARGFQKEKEEDLYRVLRYNYWTLNQFSQISGLAYSSVNNMTRPIYKGDELVTQLNFGFPFKDMEGNGNKFIYRDEKSMLYL